MSEPKRYGIDPKYCSIEEFEDGQYVSYEDYARLKAEVERLTAFTTRTFIPNEELQAEVARLKEQVERLTKAGDAMAKLLFIEPSYIGSPKQEAVVQWCKLTDDKPYA